MTKKEYIVKLLDAISPSILPIAGDILLLIHDNKISDELIDSLIAMFQYTIQETTNNRHKEKLEKGKILLSQLQHKENLDNNKDQDSIENLLKQI